MKNGGRSPRRPQYVIGERANLQPLDLLGQSQEDLWRERRKRGIKPEMLVSDALSGLEWSPVRAYAEITLMQPATGGESGA